MESIRKKMIYLLFLFVVCQSFATGFLPMKFDKRIDGEGGYQEYQIQNGTDEILRYRVVVSGKEEDIENGIVGNMDKWIEYYPKIITIKPKSTGIVKVAIKAPSYAKPGEYAARLGIVPISVPQISENGGESFGAQISLPISFTMRIFGYIGEGSPKITADLKVKKTERGTFLDGVIRNEGDVGVNLMGNYSYVDSEGRGRKSMPLGRISPGGKVEMDTSRLQDTKAHRFTEFVITGDGDNREYYRYKN